MVDLSNAKTRVVLPYGYGEDYGEGEGEGYGEGEGEGEGEEGRGGLSQQQLQTERACEDDAYALNLAWGDIFQTSPLVLDTRYSMRMVVG